MAEVSVIIPVYNTENYIKECLLSVMNQTYCDLEIIVVDDGSEDNSMAVCRELRKADRRIQVLCQVHQGVSAARNKGLYAASGKYVFFLDSDDVIHPCLLAELTGWAESHNTDLVFCAYTKFSAEQADKIKDRKQIYETSLGKFWKTGKTYESAGWFHEEHSKELSCIGGKMIRRSAIGTERFDESLSEGEDTVFLYHICRRQISLSCLQKEWYYYRKHPESSTAFHADKTDAKNLTACKMIRDNEYQNGHISWALEWEYRYVWKLLSKYLAVKSEKDAKGSRTLKKVIRKEKKYFLYQKLSVRTRFLFKVLYLGCTYIPPVRILWMLKQRLLNE